MVGIILIGLGVLGAGIGIQQIILRNYRKNRQGTPYYNPEIQSPDMVLTKFFSSVNLETV